LTPDVLTMGVAEIERSEIQHRHRGGNLRKRARRRPPVRRHAVRFALLLKSDRGDVVIGPEALLQPALQAQIAKRKLKAGRKLDTFIIAAAATGYGKRANAPGAQPGNERHATIEKVFATFCVPLPGQPVRYTVADAGRGKQPFVILIEGGAETGARKAEL